MTTNDDLQYKQAQALDNAAFADTLVGTDVIFRSLAEGNRYTFAHLFEGVADGSTVRVFADLPSDASAPVTVGARQITSSGGLRGETYANVSQDTAGTTDSSRNDKISPDAQDASNVDWETGGTYSGLGDPVPFLNPGGRAEGTRTGATGLSSTGYVEPGANLLWEMTSQAADNDILFTVVYSEDVASNGE